ncbi:hypothetical protein M405DRAFT_612821 [Rhizopogon salebrosus TDB-379]|nr:hypothetical protein M405DRAFT_612821 [Rhizopogon salebrosus TDB-379]
MNSQISKRITSAMSCNRLKLSELSTGGVHKKGCGGIEQPESDSVALQRVSNQEQESNWYTNEIQAGASCHYREQIRVPTLESVIDSSANKHTIKTGSNATGNTTKATPTSFHVRL